jgi:protease IV
MEDDKQQQETSQPKKRTFGSLLKNIFWIILILQFAPSVFKNIQKSIKDVTEPKDHVAQLELKGFIGNSTTYIKEIQKHLKDPTIRAMLLKIESPGGFPGSSQAIFNELKKFKEKKPIIAIVENMATSASYYIASVSNHIIANPSSLIGNIGVWLSMPPNVKELTDKWGVKFTQITTGKYKAAGSPFKESTPEELQMLQSVSDDSYDQFIKDVADQRNLSVKKHTEWADGKVFTGNQAFKLKLIDQLGSYSQAIEKIKELASLEKEIRFVKQKRPSKLMQLLGADDDYNSEESSFIMKMSNFISNVIDGVVVKQRSSADTINLK